MDWRASRLDWKGRSLVPCTKLWFNDNGYARLRLTFLRILSSLSRYLRYLHYVLAGSSVSLVNKHEHLNKILSFQSWY